MLLTHPRTAFEVFLRRRDKYISNRNFIMIAAVLVGIGGGLAAVLMKLAVHYVRYVLTLGVQAKYHNYLFFIFPMMGIVFTVFYKVFGLRKYFVNGLGNLLYTVSRESSLVPRHEMYSNIIGSSLTVGFGGSVGLETPIVTTGAAIGSNLGRIFRLGYKKRTLLIACGVAAGIGGIFNAPVTGVVFTLEVLLFEFSVPAFVPILISAVTGTLVSKYLMGDEILFSSSTVDAFFMHDIPFYILLGVITGLLSSYFLKAMDTVREAISKSFKSPFKRAIFGGLMLGVLVFIFPPLYGEGYANIKSLLAGGGFKLFEESFIFSSSNNQSLLLLFILCMIFLKVIASAITIGVGGNGGVFAPSLFSGGLCGYFIARAINMTHLLPFELSEKNFMLVGMAGLISGVFHAPLTALFLIAEITGGYTLILPLMIVSAIAFATSAFFEPHSIYIKQLAEKGHIHTQDKDRAVLTMLQLKSIIESDFRAVPVNGRLADLVEAVANSRRNIYPVLDEQEELRGIIHLDDIRHLIFKPELYESISIMSLMHMPSASIRINDEMESVMKVFDETGEWNLPVTDTKGKFAGLVSKSKIFSHYRDLLKQQAKEDIEIIE